MSDRKRPNKLNWNRTYVVIVTGEIPNVCGHMLLCVDEQYFHFDGPGPLNPPQYLGDNQDYINYLRRWDKHEFMRRLAPVVYPERAEKKLNELLGKKWFTMLFIHNCATFVKEVLLAGGNFWSFMEICPKGNFIIKDLVEKYVR